jgi:hypothetical protein
MGLLLINNKLANVYQFESMESHSPGQYWGFHLQGPKPLRQGHA